jgi:hypothetical protein
MANNIGDVFRFGNPLTDPVTGQALAAPPSAFMTNGVATDPTTVTLTIRKRDGTTLVYGWPSAADDGLLVREAVGRFYRDVEMDLDGKWVYELKGTGTAAAVEESSIRVQRRRVA